jgi:glycosyltransferase involved in cell wall biosynthesis
MVQTTMFIDQTNEQTIRGPLRVVHLAPHFDNSGNGVVNVAIDLACMQARSGIHVVFIGSEGSFAELLAREGVKVCSIPLSSTRNCFSAFRSLRTVLRDFDPDIVHAHMIPGALFGFVLRMSSRFKLVTTVHNSGRFGTELMSLGDVAICVSDHLAHEMRRRGIPSKKLRVVRNGPLNSPRLFTGFQPLPMKHPAIITVAELIAFKGIGDLIAAFSLVSATLPLAYLYILGDGPDRSKFERQAHESGSAQRIIFCGSVPDPTPYLQSADIFVLASHREGFGLVLAEARDAGCAIIATDVGGIPEVLEGGSAGILVPAQSPTHLANALKPLIEDRALLSRWRARASCNLEWLSCRRSSAETVRVYYEVCEK